MSRTAHRVGFDAPVHTPDSPYAAMQGRRYAPDSTLLLFDARHLGYRSFHTRDLSASDGTPTSILHGILEIVQSTCEAANTRRWALVWDGGLAYKRAAYPQYKCRHDRKRDPEEEREHARCQEAFRVAVEALGALGAPSVLVKEIEADDAMGVCCSLASHLATAKRNKFPIWEGLDRVMVVSGDKDFWQLARDQTPLNLGVEIWSPVAGMVIDRKYVLSRLGFEPARYVDWKALVGEPESGDNIPGVDGIGELTATKLIGLHGTLDAAISQAHISARGPKPRKVDLSLVAQEKQARLSYRLSRITTTQAHLRDWGLDPHEVFSSVLKGLMRAARVPREGNLRAYAKIVSRYDFKSLDLQRLCRVCGFTMA